MAYWKEMLLLQWVLRVVVAPGWLSEIHGESVLSQWRQIWRSGFWSRCHHVSDLGRRLDLDDYSVSIA